MRLTQRRKTLLQYLITAAIHHLNANHERLDFQTKSELAGAIQVFEKLIKEPEPTLKFEEVNTIKPIICACGDPSCYRGLTVGNDGELFLDYDVSDPGTKSISFTLPKNYVIHKVVKT